MNEVQKSGNGEQKEFITNSREEMWNLARDFVNMIHPSENVFCLSGELGAGKTTFVQGVAKALGISTKVVSPTFVLEKRYEIPEFEGKRRFKRLIHIDAYRLSHGKEILPLRFEETCADPENLVLIEWPEKVESAIPKGARIIKFEHIDEGTRKIIL
ncbi:MAG: tRNA (adenosine(37)-N6)-threonylcarbamoyltransferase complex ATPase subunit type 1 TsaE [bacterium]